MCSLLDLGQIPPDFRTFWTISCISQYRCCKNALCFASLKKPCLHEVKHLYILIGVSKNMTDPVTTSGAIFTSKEVKVHLLG